MKLGRRSFRTSLGCVLRGVAHRQTRHMNSRAYPSASSLPGLTRQSIALRKKFLRRGWMRGSSPRMTSYENFRRHPSAQYPSFPAAPSRADDVSFSLVTDPRNSRFTLSPRKQGFESPRERHIISSAVAFQSVSSRFATRRHRVCHGGRQDRLKLAPKISPRLNASERWLIG
jgi:hypothetical protein